MSNFYPNSHSLQRQKSRNLLTSTSGTLLQTSQKKLSSHNPSKVHHSQNYLLQNSRSLHSKDPLFQSSILSSQDLSIHSNSEYSKSEQFHTNNNNIAYPTVSHPQISLLPHSESEFEFYRSSSPSSSSSPLLNYHINEKDVPLLLPQTIATLSQKQLSTRDLHMTSDRDRETMEKLYAHIHENEKTLSLLQQEDSERNQSIQTLQARLEQSHERVSDIMRANQDFLLQIQEILKEEEEVNSEFEALQARTLQMCPFLSDPT